jgi:hypothetical protein
VQSGTIAEVPNPRSDLSAGKNPERGIQGPACPEGGSPVPFLAHRLPVVVVVSRSANGRVPRGAVLCKKRRPVCTRDTCFPTEESFPTVGRRVICQKTHRACTPGTKFLTERTLAAVRLSESPSRVYTRGAISDHDTCNEAAPTAVMCLLPTALSESASRVYTQDEVSDSGKGRPTGTCEHSSHL